MMSGKNESKIEIPTPDEVVELVGTPAGTKVEEGGKSAAASPAEEALRAEIAELKDKLARARAELVNTQRRMTNERAEALRYALAGFVRELLPALDDLARTIEAAQSAEGKEGIVAGAKLIYENMQKLLAAHQVEPIEALGKAFDPTQHEAMMQQESADVPPNTVLTEVLRGYRLHERVIRPAKVIVSRAPQTCEPSAADVGDAAGARPRGEPEGN